MALADQPIPAPRNRLLAALPAAELAQLWPRLEQVELEFRKTLHAPEEPIDSVYFPEVGYCSRLAPMEDGDSAEVGLGGPEGMTGMSLLLGADRENFEMHPCAKTSHPHAERPTHRKAVLRLIVAPCSHWQPRSPCSPFGLRVAPPRLRLGFCLSLRAPVPPARPPRSQRRFAVITNA